MKEAINPRERPVRNLQTPPVRKLLEHAKRLEPKMMRQLETLVRIESPSSEKAAVDRAMEQVARWAAALGGKVKMHRQRHYGDSLEAFFGPQSSKIEAALLLGHLDTVWERSTILRMPYKVTKDRIFGPGVLDMKAGVVMMLGAISILAETKTPRRPVRILLHGDEEVGSPASRRLTESLARRSRAVYVLEPAQGKQGAYKTARKGVGQFRLEVQGRAAHSGVDFASGHSAVLELAHQLEALARIAQPDKGITLNAGQIGGGTRPNVVPAEAWAEIDARIVKSRDGASVEQALRRLRPRDPACKLTLTGGWNRPPMERTSSTVALFTQALEFAAQLGFELTEASTGGGSDGNFTAALGIPTLDGMGAPGEGAHALSEHILRRHLAPRTALLAAMLQ